MVQGLEREAEARADEHARYEHRLWRGPAALVMHLGVQAMNWTRLAHLVGVLARRAELDHPHLVEVDIPVHDLPPALAGLRIGHLSDFHVGAHVSLADLRRALALLAPAQPDLVVITGDFVDHRPRDIVPTTQALAGLSAPLGVFGVLGNHDHRVGGRRLLAALAEHAPAVRMLVNSAGRVPLPDGELWVAGLDSVYLGLADAETALARVPAGAPCLVLSHEPDAVDHLPRPVLLTLAGHAHGGQIRLGNRPLLLPPLGRRYHTGLNQSPSGPIYTSRGVGWTGIPLRLFCPAEVAILRLVPAT